MGAVHVARDPPNGTTMTGRNQIEPGVLPLYKLFVWTLWVIYTLGLCTLGLPNRDTPPLDGLLLWGFTSVLLLYLHWKPLKQWLGGWYLPLSLWVLTLVPILRQVYLTAYNMSQGLTGDAALHPSNGLYLWLLMPLLLISAQYGVKTMLFFSFGTTVLPIALNAVLFLLGGPGLEDSMGHGAVRMILFAMIGFIVVRLTNAQRQQREELAAKNAQLADYAITLEQLAITRERNRLARELHDTLAHTLSAVNVQLKAVDVLLERDPAAARETLRQTQDLTRTGLHEARRALNDLRARPIAELGMVLALKRLAQQAAERAGTDLRVDLPQQWHDLQETVEQNLYRIAEEALNNIVRHAQATRISVRLRQSTDQVELVVKDDGIGFDAAADSPNGHYGLDGIHERALLIDGDLNITSQPGRGTVVRVTIMGDGALHRSQLVPRRRENQA